MPVINPIPTFPSTSPPCLDWDFRATCDLSETDPAILSLAVTAATQTLWGLTGMRFGLCEVTLRPCSRECDSFLWPPGDGWNQWGGGSWGYPYPTLIGGQWFNLGCGSCSGDCSCSFVSEFLLPAPVERIVEIKLDGTPMPTGSYRLDNNRIVVRTDGQIWPTCNDLNLDDTEVGTWSATALFGEPVPAGAELAMGQLVCEIVRAARGEACSLPPGLTQLVRQGVTIQYPDVGELFRQGRTGLYLVDMFINTWNPYNLRQRSRVYSVERPQVRRAGT